MPTILRNIFAVILGLFVGGALNMALVVVSPHVIPIPEGVDPMDSENLRANIHRFEPKHFVFPFLAHALGTLVGALVAFLVAGSRRAMLAYVIGVCYLLGGIAAAFMIPAPVWFIVLDLVVAYIPMAWIGIQLGRRFTGGAKSATS